MTQPWPTPEQSGYMMLLATASQPYQAGGWGRITNAEYKRLAQAKKVREAK